jgi:hypothetical protein
MRRPCLCTTVTVCLVAAIALSGRPALAADISVGLPEPTAAPGPANDFNCTSISDVDGQPIGQGDTITIGSSSEIASVANGTAAGGKGAMGSVGSPYQLSNGNWNVDFKIDKPGGVDVLVITYKSGKKRCLLIGVGQKEKLTFTAKASGLTPGNVLLSYSKTDGTIGTMDTATLRNWVPVPPPGPTPQKPASGRPDS